MDRNRPDELSYRLRQQMLLSEFGVHALQCRDLDALLQRATELCADGMETPLCKALEYLPRENILLVRAGVGWDEGVVGHPKVGADLASPAGYALKTGKPVISNHLGEEDRFRTPTLLAEHGVRRAINVIIAGGVPFGILEVDSKDAGQFEEADLAFMQGFANLVGVAIERQHAERELREALEHQKILTGEISHRVKNSLQLVASLLSLQARNSNNPEVSAALNDAVTRISTMSRLHDQLWRYDDVQAVNLVTFLRELCEGVQATSPGHTLNFAADAAVTIPVHQAVPLGLVVNELVTNAFKYAYVDGAGMVSVRLSASEDEQISIEVCDRGAGLPQGFDVNGAARSGSLGMKLVVAFTRQLEAELVVSTNNPGACFRIDVPKLELQRRPVARAVGKSPDLRL